MRAALEEILEAARERQKWEYGRRGVGKEGEDDSDSESNGLWGGEGFLV